MKISNAPEEIINYLQDSSNFAKGYADELFIPENSYEVIEAVRLCAEKKKPLTISGAGTGNVAGRIPLSGAILSTERLNKIIDINVKEKTITVESGVRVEEIIKTVSSYNLFYPSYPTEILSFIGGNVATNASGEFSFRYGSVRNYVIGIKVVLSNGKVIHIKRSMFKADRNGNISFDGFSFKIPSYISPVIKNSAGYYSCAGMDLIDLFIGNEGTLGVITEVELKLIDKPFPSFSMFIFFQNETDALEFVKEIKKNVKMNNEFINPLCLEYLDSNSLKFLREEDENIPINCGATVFLEQEFKTDEEKTISVWDEFVGKYNPLDCWFAEKERSKKKLMDFRRLLPQKVNEYLRINKMLKTSLDIAVPEDMFDEMFNFYKRGVMEIGVDFLLFGHIGENHLHMNLFPKNETEKIKTDEFCLNCAKKAVSLGGTVSAEHGIGKLRHKYLEIMYGNSGIDEMARIKKIIDPHLILGLDNIFSSNYLYNV